MTRVTEGRSVQSHEDEVLPSPTAPRHSPNEFEAEKADTDQPQKKRRLNRPITSCATCRRHKTRCETGPGRRACQRCISLRLDCDLPVAPEIDELSVAASAADPTLQLHMLNIEQSLEKLTALVQTVIDQSMLQVAPRGASPLTSLHLSRHRRESTPVTRHSNGQSLSGVTRPVLLVRNLQTQFFGPKRDFSDEQLAVGSVVSAGIISPSLAQSLVRIWIKHNGLWISVASVQDIPPDIEQRHPLLFSTVCLLAARHVPRVAKETVHDMYMRVRRLASSVVFKAPYLDYEDLQALTLLSMFTPTIQTAMPIDSWMVSGIALNHATLAFGFTSPEPVPADGTEEQLRRLRILNALCLTNIQFSIGNGRPCMVQPRFVEQCSRIVDFPDARTTDGKLYAEVLLYAKTESILSNGPSTRWKQPNVLVVPELAEFQSEWGHLFDLPECLSLKFGCWYCHLLLYRASLRGNQPDPALRESALKMSSDILELFLEQEFSVVLDMPDHFFFMVIYAGLTLCKWAIENPLIAAAQNCLTDLAPNDEHIAYRFGTVLAELRKKAAAAGAKGLEGGTEGGETSPAGDGVAATVDFLPGNDDYTWDTFLGWTTETGMNLGMGLEDPVAYGTGGLTPGINTG
ncbi:hypothetical protein CONLIGDRAFT_690403 [Coniochaeta ligniaria NRRL 30616]|uniref:Transcriptional activator of proteases prtT n=1 Tax=Coniochaeta ligniaria NRRL 30616 TaxID=1408157 RepID=A0A1J7K641_9PEZI|nr:hypothetical protein CONLIGDRAFT_690403 [Coniochaeta ligniaria NRRL 30616]